MTRLVIPERGQPSPSRVAAVLAVCAIGLAACRDKPRESAADAGATTSVSRAPWPALPTGDLEAARLVERATRRPAEDRIAADVDASRLLWAAIDRTGAASLVAGFDAIDAWIAARVTEAARKNRAAYVVFGAKHDAAAPIDAFRRLVGASSASGFSRLVVEQFHATGRWAGIDASLQRGEDDALTRYYATGASDAFAELRRSHEEHDYAAWKLGYTDQVMDLVPTSRATSRPIVPCDMPTALAQRLALSEDLTLRMRELHCARALEDALTLAHPPHRVAALWGEAHVGAEGFPRFLPADAEVLVVRIARAPAFDVVDPVLVPPRTSDEDALLVLADPAAAKWVDRQRTHTRSCASGRATFRRLPLGDDPKNGRDVPIDAHLDGRSLAIRAEPTETTLSVGAHVLVMPRSSRRLIMAVPMPPASSVAVEVSPLPESFTVTVKYEASPSP